MRPCPFGPPWLALEHQFVQQFRGRLRQNLFGSRDLETLDRIAASMGELQWLYRDMDPDQSALEEAIATGGLVLVTRGSRREAYWAKERVSVDWFRYKKPWQMLVKLVLFARTGAVVGWQDLYAEGPSNSTMASRWDRLKSLLPATLAKWVRPGGELGTYRLTLPQDQIHVFTDDG